MTKRSDDGGQAPRHEGNLTMAERDPYPSEKQERFIVRLPDGMRDRIKAAAEANNRSMNAEIVARIEASFLHEKRFAALRRSISEPQFCIDDRRDTLSLRAQQYKEEALIARTMLASTTNEIERLQSEIEAAREGEKSAWIAMLASANHQRTFLTSRLNWAETEYEKSLAHLKQYDAEQRDIT